MSRVGRFQYIGQKPFCVILSGSDHYALQMQHVQIDSLSGKTAIAMLDVDFGSCSIVGENDAPAVGKGIPRGPGIPQLFAVLPVGGPHPLVHHAAVVASRVGK